MALLTLLVALLAITGMLVTRSLILDEAFSTQAWAAVVRERVLLERLGVSAGQAAAAMAAGVAVGLPASFFLSRRGLPMRAVFMGLWLVPAGIPPVVYAIGAREALGDTLARPNVALASIVLAHAAFTAGAVTWLVTPAWRTADPRAIEAARILGATGRQAFHALVWPAVSRQLWAAAGLGFAFAFTAFATVLVLGGAGERTLEATAFERAGLTASVARVEAAAIVLVQTILLAVLFTLTRGWWRWPEAAPRDGAVASVAVRALGVAYLFPLAVLLIVPPVAVAFGALTAGGAFDLAPFRGLLDATVARHDVTDVLLWTLLYALTAAVVATPLAWALANWTRDRARREVMVVIVVLLALSPVTLGLAFSEVTRLAADAGIVAGRQSALVVAAHAMLAVPLAWRVLNVPSGDSRLRRQEAALLLGERPSGARRRWDGRRLPLALVACALFVTALSAGEAAAAWLLAPEGALPAAVVLLDAATMSESSRATLALATVLGGVTLLAFFAADALRRAAQAGAR